MINQELLRRAKAMDVSFGEGEDMTLKALIRQVEEMMSGIPTLMFARARGKGVIGMVLATSEDDSGVTLVFNDIREKNYNVGDIIERDGTPDKTIAGWHFYLPESVDEVIKALQTVKEELINQAKQGINEAK